MSSRIATVVDALGAGQPRLLRLVTLVRDQHLRVLAALLAAGGRGLLVSDLVSSDTCPALRNAPDHALQAIADRALAEQNFFTGTNPRVVAERLGELPVSDVHLLRPWRWRIG